MKKDVYCFFQDKNIFLWEGKKAFFHFIITSKVVDHLLIKYYRILIYDNTEKQNGFFCL